MFAVYAAVHMESPGAHRDAEFVVDCLDYKNYHRKMIKMDVPHLKVL